MALRTYMQRERRRATVCGECVVARVLVGLDFPLALLVCHRILRLSVFTSITKHAHYTKQTCTLYNHRQSVNCFS